MIAQIFTFFTFFRVPVKRPRFLVPINYCFKVCRSTGQTIN